MRRILGMVAAAGLGLGLLFATAGLAGAQTTTVTRVQCIVGGGTVQSFPADVSTTQPDVAQSNDAGGGPVEFYSTGAGGPQFYSFGGGVAQPIATGFVVVQPTPAVVVVAPQQNFGAVMNVRPNATGGNDVQLIQPGTAGGSTVQNNGTVNYCVGGTLNGNLVE